MKYYSFLSAYVDLLLLCKQCPDANNLVLTDAFLPSCFLAGWRALNCQCLPPGAPETHRINFLVQQL